MTEPPKRRVPHLRAVPPPPSEAEALPEVPRLRALAPLRLVPPPRPVPPPDEPPRGAA